MVALPSAHEHPGRRHRGRRAGPGGQPRPGAGDPGREGRGAARDGRRAAGARGRRSSPPTPRTSRAPSRAARPPTSSTGCGSPRTGWQAMAQGLRDVAGLPDPVGEVVRGSTLANGLELRQVRVPFGVVGMIYEARPNVTADAAGICLKSGNAVLLRGSSSARSSNAAIVAVLRDAVAAAGLDAGRRPAGARRHPRQRQGADARPRPRRRADPARGSGADPVGRRGVDGARDRDRRRQLPRVRRPRRRPRQGARDRAERQDPPHQRLQRGRVAAGARRRRRRVPAAGGDRAPGRRRHHPRRRRVRGVRRGRGGDRRGLRARSTSRSTSPPPSYPTWTRRSPTSGAAPASTPRRS